MRTVVLLASDSSHLPLLTVFQESGVTQKYGFAIRLEVVGEEKAPTMSHRSRLILAGEIDFLSGLHHETYRARARGERRFAYLAQAQNNWDDRLIASQEITRIQDLEGKRIVCHSSAPCVTGNLRAVLENCGLKREEIHIETVKTNNGKYSEHVDLVASGEAQAVLVDMPFDLYGKRKGLRLMELPDRPVIHNTTLLCTTDYIKENEAMVINFLKAFIEAIHFFKTRPTEVVRILKKNLSHRYGLEEEEYYVHLQREWAGLLSQKPYPLPSAIQNVYDLDAAKEPAMKNVGPMEPWDLHYLRVIDDTGFIDKLYAG